MTLFRGTSTMEKFRNLIKFNKGNEKSCTWGAVTPCAIAHWGRTARTQLCSWKQLFSKIPRMFLDAEINLSQQCLLALKKSNTILGCIRKSFPAGWGTWSFPLRRAEWLWWGTSAVPSPVLGSLVQETWTYWSTSSKGPWRWWRG